VANPLLRDGVQVLVAAAAAALVMTALPIAAMIPLFWKDIVRMIVGVILVMMMDVAL